MDWPIGKVNAVPFFEPGTILMLEPLRDLYVKVYLNAD